MASCLALGCIHVLRARSLTPVVVLANFVLTFVLWHTDCLYASIFVCFVQSWEGSSLLCICLAPQMQRGHLVQAPDFSRGPTTLL